MQVMSPVSAFCLTQSHSFCSQFGGVLERGSAEGPSGVHAARTSGYMYVCVLVLGLNLSRENGNIVRVCDVAYFMQPKMGAVTRGVPFFVSLNTAAGTSVAGFLCDKAAMLRLT